MLPLTTTHSLSVLGLGVNVNVVDASGNRALHHIVQPSCTSTGRTVSENCYKLCCSLLQAGADPNAINSNGKTPLYLAVANGLLDVAENMVSRGGNPNVSGNDEVLLCVVCEKQNMRLVEAFLKQIQQLTLTVK